MDCEVSSSSQQDQKELGWMEWLKGWYHLICEVLFQKWNSRHLPCPLPLPPLDGVTCIVTGSTSGMGLEIAKLVAQSGARLVMAVRNTNTANEIIKNWKDDHERCNNRFELNIDIMELDLLCLASVVKFSEDWNNTLDPLHILINNAGIFSIGQPLRFSRDGHETHMQVNHLGSALLSILLLPSLKRSTPSRIINMNSLIHWIGYVDTDDMNFKERKFSSLRAYSSSKLAQLKFSSVLQRNIPADVGIDVICVDPESVRTNVARDLSRWLQSIYKMIPFFIFNAQEGSRSAIFAASDPYVPRYCRTLRSDEWPVCSYLAYNCKPINPSKEAHNLVTSNMVWQKTLEMVGLSSDAVNLSLEGKEVACRYKNYQHIARNILS